MPSSAYIDFLELLEDVDNLRATHIYFSKGKKGRKRLGFLTRSAIVMLSAAWERYNENLLLECIDKILETAIEAKNLPTEIKKYISGKVKNNKNEIYPIELADGGWKRLWKGYAINETDILNTPNSDNLKKLFSRYLGINDCTAMWKPNSSIPIDELIHLRGEIAHNGSKAKYVKYNTLIKNIDLLIDNAIQFDSSIHDYLCGHPFNLNSPWDKTYHRDQESYKKG